MALLIAPSENNIEIFDKDKNKLELDFFINQVANIPYADTSNAIWEVDPEKKSIKTMNLGEGNCSNFVFGASYKKIFNNQISILYLMPKNGSFLSKYGHGGHMVMIANTKYNKEVIIDYDQASIPMIDNEFLNHNLKINEDLEIKKVNLSKLRITKPNNYYNFDYLNKIFFAKSTQFEIIEYFKFIKKYYIPITYSYFDKVFYDYLAIYFNKYPKIYIEEKYLNEIRKNKNFIFLIAKLFLYISYIIPLLFITFLINIFLNKIFKY